MVQASVLPIQVSQHQTRRPSPTKSAVLARLRHSPRLRRDEDQNRLAEHVRGTLSLYVPRAVNKQRFFCVRYRTDRQFGQSTELLEKFEGDDDKTFAVYAVKMFADGLEQELDGGDKSFKLSDFLKKHVEDAWKPPIEPRFGLFKDQPDIHVSSMTIRFERNADFKLASGEVVSLLRKTEEERGREFVRGTCP